MARYSNGESVFSRLARLLEAFEDDSPVITVSELSKRTGLSLPTVSRMVSELVERGWLQRDADRRVWIGLRMWELVSRAAPTRDLVRTAVPFMTELSARIGQNVHLSVRQGSEAMFIETFVPNTDAARAMVPLLRTTGAQISRALAARNTPAWQPDSEDPQESEDSRHNARPARSLRNNASVFALGRVVMP
ncbi:IclR family transcriptional regulator [Nocardia vaccinii]|uniref:IclR family transcriptional regulator n=1 Tax=Nocardia vaccinii TaxID=1822 RepID=UPI000A027931|nr:helix-turn-helix domain-containing protein [Nocardia vaccinii]